MERMYHKHVQESRRRQDVFHGDMLYVDRLAEKRSEIAM